MSILITAWAHRNGGWKWSDEEKELFANDPRNLLIVEDNLNAEKADSGPDE